MHLASALTSSKLWVGHFIPAVLSLTFVLSVAWDRRPVVDETTLVGEAVPHVASHMSGVTIRWSAYRFRECPVRVYWEIVDLAGEPWNEKSDDPAEQFRNVTGWDVWTTRRPVHPSAAWGQARYRSTLSYRCGWSHLFWPFTITAPEVPFEIVEAK